jgi:hypothetical protein
MKHETKRSILLCYSVNFKVAFMQFIGDGITVVFEEFEPLLKIFTYNTKYFPSVFCLMTYLAQYCGRVVHKTENCGIL